MSNTMTAHEPINYLDSILSEEEKRCEQYSHQRRNFTISRSGRFKSKNKHRNVVDGKMFDRCTAVNAASSNVTSDKDKVSGAVIKLHTNDKKKKNKIRKFNFRLLNTHTIGLFFWGGNICRVVACKLKGSFFFVRLVLYGFGSSRNNNKNKCKQTNKQT